MAGDFSNGGFGEITSGDYINIPYRGSGGPLHLLVDSTGIKVEGEGEWNARKHGGTKGVDSGGGQDRIIRR